MKKIFCLAFLIAVIITSCKVIKPGVNYSKTDSTIVKYVPVDLKVKGAKVLQALNVDSLAKYAAARRKFLMDSIDAVKSGLPIPVAPQMPSGSMTDPDSKAELKYKLNNDGSLDLSCESKDQLVQFLVAELTKLTKEKTTVSEIVKETPNWAYMVMGGLAFLLIISVLKNFFTINRK